MSKKKEVGDGPFTPMSEEMLKDMPESQQEFFRLLTKKEDLHPDLSPYLETRKGLGRVLKHPLVFDIFYHPQSNARLNKQYEVKQKYIAATLEDGKFAAALWLYERPYRMERFYEWRDRMPDDVYWDLLGKVWTDSENLWQYDYLLEILLRSERPGRDKMMNDREKAFLADLPDEFTIYRGHQGRNKAGWSWSLSHTKARWFAGRFQHKRAAVTKATVKKSAVIAYLGGRNEYEIVADPSTLFDVKTFRNARTRVEWVRVVLDEARAAFRLNIKRSSHGPDHWTTVESNGMKLGRGLPDCDLRVVQLFALLHDSKRENEDDDPDHGKRAAEYIEELWKRKLLHISDVQKKLLAYACHHHNGGQTTDNMTVGVCWDADRLDLIRVGITPDPKFLSTARGKEMMWKL